MLFLKIPLSRWPLRFHIAATCLVLIAMVGGTVLLMHAAIESVDAQRTESQVLEARLQALMQEEKKRPLGSFMQTFPSVSSSDDVVRDMGRHAEAMKVQIASLAIAVSDPAPGLLRNIQFNVAASGEYSAMKGWLAEMLGRYPSLGVQSLSLRGRANESVRQDMQLVLVLFVRD